MAEGRGVTPQYFAAMSIPLLAGRYFTEDDDSKAEKPIIINQRFAQLYFAHRNPLEGGSAGGQPMEHRRRRRCRRAPFQPGRNPAATDVWSELRFERRIHRRPLSAATLDRRFRAAINVEVSWIPACLLAMFGPWAT
jgi:hypothetical protein